MKFSWLKNYYGEALATTLNATVIMERDSHAVVRICDKGKFGYVLVKKYGRHSATPHESLHEGVAGVADMERMKKRLEDVER